MGLAGALFIVLVVLAAAALGKQKRHKYLLFLRKANIAGVPLSRLRAMFGICVSCSNVRPNVRHSARQGLRVAS